MKRFTLFICLLAMSFAPAAQQKTKKSSSNTSRAIKKTKPMTEDITIGLDPQRVLSFSLEHASSYEAFAPGTRDAMLSKPGLNYVDRIGMNVTATVPEGTYGFANGKISLYPLGSTSTGTITGSGSVGTGTGPGSIGIFSPVVGINGKSPYTGNGPYGTRIPALNQAAIDSLRARVNSSKD